MKVNNFLGPNQGKPPLGKMERQLNPELIGKICLFGAEFNRTISWEQHFNGYFDDLLKAEYI